MRLAAEGSHGCGYDRSADPKRPPRLPARRSDFSSWFIRFVFDLAKVPRLEVGLDQCPNGLVASSAIVVLCALRRACGHVVSTRRQARSCADRAPAGCRGDADRDVDDHPAALGTATGTGCWPQRRSPFCGPMTWQDSWHGEGVPLRCRPTAKVGDALGAGRPWPVGRLGGSAARRLGGSAAESACTARRTARRTLRTEHRAPRTARRAPRTAHR
jgi:hypothetical protein